MRINSNIQIPISKQYQIPKSSITAVRSDVLAHFGYLIFGNCLEFGAWDLEFPAGFHE
jgi:hypothetical protein